MSSLFTERGFVEGFFDELEKIANSGAADGEMPAEDLDQKKEQQSKNDFWERAKRHGIDLGVTAAGYGVGYGVGRATGAYLSNNHGFQRSSITPHLLGAGVAAAGLASRVLDRHRQHYRDTGQTL